MSETTTERIRQRIAELLGWSIGEDHHGEYWQDARGMWTADRWYPLKRWRSIDDPLARPFNDALRQARRELSTPVPEARDADDD